LSRWMITGTSTSGNPSRTSGWRNVIGGERLNEALLS
jgi:hypothetical protein